MELGFEDWFSSVTSLPSTWRQKRDLVNHTTQTDDIVSEEKGIQSMATKHTEVQTTTEENSIIRPLSAEEFEKLPPSVFAFFSRVTYPVCQYLEQNCDPFGTEVFQDTGDENVGTPGHDGMKTFKEFTLRSDSVQEEFTSNCLAWSKAGSQIAVGYSYPSHDAWCSHKAPVCSWNILRRKQNFHENHPTAEIFLPSCVCSIEFHPMDSSILAVGLYSGEVAIVDLFSVEKGSVSVGGGSSGGVGAEDLKQDLSTSGFISDFGYTSYSAGHTAPLVSVKWVRLSPAQYSDILQSGGGSQSQVSVETVGSHCCLLTASKDGYISLWSTNRANNRLKLEKRFIVWADNLPDEVIIGNRNVNGMKEVGVTGLSLCKDDPFAFVFSTFGSFLFQGNLLSQVEAYEAECILQDHLPINRDTLFSPAPVLLGQEEAFIVALDCSPFHRNVFLCGTSDGRVLLKNLLQPSKPRKELIAASTDYQGEGFLISDAQWSTTRPMMLGVTSGTTLKIFDLLVGETPVASISHEHLVTKLAFNKSGSDTVAVADDRGQVHIWKLPLKITSQDPREMELFVEATSVITDM